MDISEHQIDKRLTELARKMGKKNASSLLSVLGKNKQFVDALDSSIGQELLKDAVACIEGKIELILAEKDEPKDRAELKAYLNIVNKWQSIIVKYDKDKELFNKNVI